MEDDSILDAEYLDDVQGDIEQMFCETFVISPEMLFEFQQTMNAATVELQKSGNEICKLRAENIKIETKKRIWMVCAITACAFAVGAIVICLWVIFDSTH